MTNLDPKGSDRRDFLKTGALAGASALAVGAGVASATTADEPTNLVPTRPLGRTGVNVSILSQGTWKAPDSLDRLLRTGYAAGVRYFDTAKSYQTEPGIAKWFDAIPEVRKTIFLVTKDSPRTPKDLPAMLDQRLANLKTDYVDLIFVHALGDHHPLQEAIDFAGGDEFKRVAEAIRKSGKAKFVGFSTHHRNRDQILAAAAKGGFVDAIMVQNTAWLDKDTELNRSLDAVHKAGIGLISMKQIAGPRPAEFLGEVPKKAPELIEKGLKPYGAMLHAIWTDERFSACCVSMRNTDQLRDNIAAAKSYQPLKAAQIEALRDAFLASNPSLCADCNGQCSLAAGTDAALGDLTRYLTYFEQHGIRGEARQRYAELTERARDWKGADLAAARAACPSHLDFASLLPRVEEHLA